ncbi:MAG: DUF1573 domain-containing protein [Proteobacteria bacterium]|nr:hypothetical protein [Desulfobacteraceae bacterium]MBU0735649.1 DUF1573 domain-containing protein [Pseudomonadota bacterium]MBU1905253.1 DUF1573 domain-containing protein [Pseudomonadota bacterium]
MTRKVLIISAFLFLTTSAFAFAGQPIPEHKEVGPIIYFDKTTHTFPPVFEGEVLSHTFTVSNRGTVNLDLKKVTHS